MNAYPSRTDDQLNKAEAEVEKIQLQLNALLKK
jgi:hypothetical protein